MVKSKTSTTKEKPGPANEKQMQPAAETSSSTQLVSGSFANVSPNEKILVVGIGASAGGLAALEQFFSAIQKDTNMGMAFVIVQHMAPAHKSMLAEIIRRYTRMNVYDVKDGMAVRSDCVYIIQPNRDMIIMDGILHLMEPAEAHGHRMPIDSFFRSLASYQQERAIGIILSGTGSDGTQGIKIIKAEGGMLMAQDPETSEYNGMPLSAIETGLVDYILKPAEMPAQLLDHISRISVAKLDPSANDEEAMKMIFNELLTQTGHDFSQYKQKTLDRRIKRRMAVNDIKYIDGYARYLQHKPEEIKALFSDLLINVTNFFRNPKVFEVLQEQVIPLFFAGKSPNALVRIWVVGSSTGDEAYSIGILLQEEMDKLKQTFKVQIFATDIDSRAIDQARKGVYPSSISTDVPPERLTRFFIYDPDLDTYSIQKKIREMVIFSEQDVIRDPPFSKLDLISCRNLMIYVNKELQKKLIPMFHYALNPRGFLLLGSSESIGEFSYLFDALDKHSKLYQSKVVSGEYDFSKGPFFSSSQETSVSNRPSGKLPSENKLQMRELTERKLLQEYAPAGALVNENGEIRYLHGRTGLFLEMPPGEPGYNILKMAREGLQQALTATLSKAVIEKEQVVRPGIRVKTNGDFTIIDLTVRPVQEAIDKKLFLITFDVPPQPNTNQREKENSMNGDQGVAESADGGEEGVSALKEELRTMEEYLRAVNEELEVSNEELRSSNEEMQSMNEELETSREELQSLNEELSTVNAELQSKVAELSEANEDMNNLLARTGVGIIFVNNQLLIQRFTPAATKVINLIPTDVGRPLEHTVSNLQKYNLIPDIQAVLDTLIPREIEGHTRDGEWYIIRIQPYRTLKNSIEGAVITFLKQTEALRRLATVVRDSGDAITLQDMEGRILAWNPMAEKMYGWSETEALAMNVSRIVPENKKEEALALLKKLVQAEVPKPCRTKRVTKDGRIIDMWMTATPLVNADGDVYAIATTEREVKS
ncbi:chemotaxis protein CheB [uncultured Methanomethylovorans sp.]|uniref:chemotaxis protein CheB n=1 Tax=uncultured Methanomethylovorans sp. TaxID=183759 RepID=UPI002AA7AE25|nr:chemotaxis protein CheB [uncultured Methanomethylovorans sp.]